MRKLLYPMVIALGVLTLSQCKKPENPAPTIISVESVELGEIPAIIGIDQEVTLAWTVYPAEATNRDVEVTSSNTSVATITGGILKGVAAGTTTVTVTTVDGGKQDSFDVQVVGETSGVKFVHEDGTDVGIADFAYVGKETNFYVEFIPANAINKNYTVESDKPAIATVTKDATNPLQLNVMGIQKGGDCVFTIITEDGEFEANLNITVRQPVTTISLTGADDPIEFYPGETYPLTVAFADDPYNKNYSVTSGDSEVATVGIDANDPMKVVVTGGTKYGSTQITVTSNVDNTKTASVTVTVKEPMGKVVGISMPATATVESRGATTELTVTFNPTDADNRALTVDSSAPTFATATVADGVVTVTGLKAGTTVLTVTSADTSLGTKTATCTVTVTAAPAPKLGAVTFRSTQTWPVGNYIWSDHVTATACQKETYNPAKTATSLLVITDDHCDCRQGQFKNGTDGDKYYDVFSVGMIYRYPDVLCPDEWRLPTTADFTDARNANNSEIQYSLDAVKSVWGAELGGSIHRDLSWRGVGDQFMIGGQPVSGANGTERIAAAEWSSGMLNTSAYGRYDRQEGFGVRCVKDKTE